MSMVLGIVFLLLAWGFLAFLSAFSFALLEQSVTRRPSEFIRIGRELLTTVMRALGFSARRLTGRASEASRAAHYEDHLSGALEKLTAITAASFDRLDQFSAPHEEVRSRELLTTMAQLAVPLRHSTSLSARGNDAIRNSWKIIVRGLYRRQLVQSAYPVVAAELPPVLVGRISASLINHGVAELDELQRILGDLYDSDLDLQEARGAAVTGYDDPALTMAEVESEFLPIYVNPVHSGEAVRRLLSESLQLDDRLPLDVETWADSLLAGAPTGRESRQWQARTKV